MEKTQKPGGRPIVFLYLGRSGAMVQFTQVLAETAARDGEAAAAFVISSSNENAAGLMAAGARVHTVPTFTRGTRALSPLSFARTRKTLLTLFRDLRPAAIVNLMPHIWTPLLVRSIQRLGFPFLSIIHDAKPHPGDRTALVTPWLLREARLAVKVVTLSQTVTDDLVALRGVKRENITTLFHPDFHLQAQAKPRERQAGKPLRLLFLGRIMAYKGLDVLIQAVEHARANGADIALGVAGSGDISSVRHQLDSLDAEVCNRWLSDADIDDFLSRYDAMACSHVEASQSGIASAAFGSLMPVIAMPVGGIAEQVIDGETGVLASKVSAGAFGDAIARLANDHTLYNRISRHLLDTATNRSPARFLSDIVAAAKETSPT